jgi:hypothetical protein
MGVTERADEGLNILERGLEAIPTIHGQTNEVTNTIGSFSRLRSDKRKRDFTLHWLFIVET